MNQIERIIESVTASIEQDAEKSTNKKDTLLGRVGRAIRYAKGYAVITDPEGFFQGLKRGGRKVSQGARKAVTTTADVATRTVRGVAKVTQGTARGTRNIIRKAFKGSRKDAATTYKQIGSILAEAMGLTKKEKERERLRRATWKTITKPPPAVKRDRKLRIWMAGGPPPSEQEE